ncbi:Protein CBG19763 [Caenorhabditis briggsae]|uniref:Protein CBG19763 n=1 Tax=Caenorhabditis briggsae TaxID=6238 RepID=A8XWD4_CAEBR|nr:Protein CBG19763 [Caenorhabditis briggsae]CAP36953.2 Protein CBG19763 [Caenorhabditis briggsae]
MRRPTTTSSNQYRRIIPFNSSSLSSIPCSYLFQYYSFLILIILCSARGTVTEGGQPLTELLSSLDQPYPCGHVVEAEHFLSTAVALKFPRLIQLAHFFANHSKNFDPQLLDKSSFLPYPPFEVSFARRTHFYGLQLNCTGNNHRFLIEELNSRRVAPKRPALASRPQCRTNGFHVSSLCLTTRTMSIAKPISPFNSTNSTWICAPQWIAIQKLVFVYMDGARRSSSFSQSMLQFRRRRFVGRHMLLAFNSMCALVCIGLIPIVCYQRKRQHEARGWALMELFLIGASILYSVLFLDIVAPPEYGCCVAVWLRQIGFSIFYGSIVLKIYRNLQEYRVRKAQHVSVREQDMLKYLAAMLALTITGLMAWTVGSWGDTALWRTAWPQCLMQGWHVIWHGYELLFLLYAVRLCYKARNSDWLERWQFTVAVCLEAVITLMANLIRYSIRNSGRADTLFIVSFVHLQLTVSVNIVIIVAPKFYLSNGEPSRRSMTLGGHSGRAHPSLAKLRDNILNGTIDFAEVPIVDMNPEDIRAELKRVYTQLRMYKLKNLYQDNPHISKKRGGKKWSDKNTKATRRISIPSCSPQAKRIEEDEKSDLTVESSPHNIYLSNFKGANVNNIEQHNSVRV